MSRISHSLRANRVHTSYVNRMSHSGGVHPIAPIARSESMKNTTEHPTEQQVSSYDYYYEKQPYKKLSSEQHKKDLLKTDIEQTTEKFVRSYNLLLLSLHKSERNTSKRYVKRLEEVYSKYSEFLNNLGVNKASDQTLMVKEYESGHRANWTLENNSDSLQSFMNDVLTVYREFAHDKKKQPTNPYEIEPTEQSGFIFEERL